MRGKGRSRVWVCRARASCHRRAHRQPGPRNAERSKRCRETTTNGLFAAAIPPGAATRSPKEDSSFTCFARLLPTTSPIAPPCLPVGASHVQRREAGVEVTRSLFCLEVQVSTQSYHLLRWNGTEGNTHGVTVGGHSAKEARRGGPGQSRPYPRFAFSKATTGHRR